MSDSEQWLWQIIETIPTLLWSARTDGSADFFNRRWFEYTGLSCEEALDWGWKDAVHPDDLPRTLEAFHHALKATRPFEVEGRFRRWDGDYRWFLFRGNPLLDESGSVIKWYGTNTDIEDRKRAEDALRASEQNYRLIVESIPAPTVTFTAQGEVEYSNQRTMDYTGWTLEELKHWGPLIHPDDLASVQKSWWHSIETGQPFEVEQRIRGADGIFRWFVARALPGRDQEGKIVRWYAMLFDVDERKRAEEKLRRSEWKLLEAQRLGHSGSWTLDVASGVVTSSPEMIRVFAPGPDEDYFKPDFFFNRIHPEDRQRVRGLFELCVLQKINYEADYRLLLPDGTIRHQRSIGYPVLNEAGDLAEYIGTAYDTTEQVHARAALERSLAEIKVLKDQLHRENLALREEVASASMFEEIVGTSRGLQLVLGRLSKVAPMDSTVLITGETGTGKELIARAIHKRSRRSQGAFVSVNCAALAPSLIASELFGHEKGAFTGATDRRLGRFELANGGTIFLDEVGELPADTQVSLLRVLQEREFERVGGRQLLHVDVRVIAATNRDLAAARRSGEFRSDLFYRLNVFPIEVPPLRERKDDIVILLEYFVRRFARKVGKNFGKIEKRTLELFQSYDWPGNIRELQNVVERSVIVSSGETFSVDEAWLSMDSRVPAPQPAPEWTGTIADRERQIIEAALAQCRGRVSGPNGAAAKLRIPPSTLQSKIKKLRIPKDYFKLG